MSDLPAELRIDIDKATKSLLSNDWFLILKNIHERSITHQLASYLSLLCSPAWDVDCEYSHVGWHSRKDVDLVFEDKAGRKSPPVDWTLTLEHADALAAREISVIDTASLEQLVKDRYIYPDIIVHHRNETDFDHNLLVIELKNQQIAEKIDTFKLKQLTSGIKIEIRTNEYIYLQYQHGIFLQLGTPTIDISPEEIRLAMTVKSEYFSNGIQNDSVSTDYAITVPNERGWTAGKLGI